LAEHISDSTRRDLIRRLLTAAGVLLFVLVLGATGYHQLGAGRWSWTDCFYMTVITLSTVGYGETLTGFDTVSFARPWTIGLILLGSGTLVYFVSTFTALIVEGDLGGALRRNRMRKRVEGMKDHVIVCGVGTTGIHVVAELVATETPFVAIDQNEERLVRLQEEYGDAVMHYVAGDATDDEVLRAAGIERCRGVVSALHDDKDNLFVTVTVRALNPRTRIVAKAIEPSAVDKMRRAGADSVVSTNYIGGMRLVSEMIRPQVTQFLDHMLRDRTKNLRIEEVEIPAASPLVGLALRDTALRKATDALVIAVREPAGEIVHNPPPDLVLSAGLTLIVLARTKDVVKLREGVRDGSIGRA
jgi:voltage-gated potassium channel